VAQILFIMKIKMKAGSLPARQSANQWQDIIHNGLMKIGRVGSTIHENTIFTRVGI
jgi:hypothetical protein